MTTPTAQPLSAVVTTYNNAATIERCLRSLAFADELLVLDSGSNDQTVALASALGARIETAPFAGYSAQKQRAIDLAQHRWVLLLDADEYLADEAAAAIYEALKAPQVAGYRFARVEWQFFAYAHRWTRHNRYLRLFDRTRVAMNKVPVHAAPATREPVADLPVRFFHDGEPDIATKVAKLNAYSTGLVDGGARRSQPRLRMLFAPPYEFLRQYLGKRQFVNGWSGFIASVCMAFYAFLKAAKSYEAGRRR